MECSHIVLVFFLIYIFYYGMLYQINPMVHHPTTVLKFYNLRKDGVFTVTSNFIGIIIFVTKMSFSIVLLYDSSNYALCTFNF